MSAKLQLEALEDRCLPSITPALILPVAGKVRAMAVGDLNGDGRPEILTGNWHGRSLQVFVNEYSVGEPAYQTPQRFRVGRGLTYLSLLDINADGRLDVAASCGNSNRLVLYLNQTTRGSSDIEFGPRRAIRLDHNCTAWADFNDDGLPDLAAVNRETGRLITFVNSTSPGSSIVKLDHRQSIDVGFGCRWVTAFDMDQNGVADLAASCTDLNRLVILRNRTVSNADRLQFALAAEIQVAGGPRDMVCADLDGNGLTDLVVAQEHGSGVMILHNQSHPGTVQFAARQVALHAPIRAVTVADYDKDGYLDIVASTLQAGGGVGIVHFLRMGRPPGLPTFFEEFTLAATEPILLALGDLNSDRIPDLVVASRSGAIIIHWGPLSPLT